MNDYRNILVPIDFSDAAQAVARRARLMAEDEVSRLTLVHVVEYAPPVALGYEPVLGPEWEVDQRALVEQAETQLGRLAEEAGLAEAIRLVLIGPIRGEIERVARERGCDLIVIGSHGRHGIGRLLGSTARSVVNNAPCDVLAVRVGE